MSRNNNGFISHSDLRRKDFEPTSIPFEFRSLASSGHSSLLTLLSSLPFLQMYNKVKCQAKCFISSVILFMVSSFLSPIQHAANIIRRIISNDFIYLFLHILESSWQSIISVSTGILCWFEIPNISSLVVLMHAFLMHLFTKSMSIEFLFM